MQDKETLYNEIDALQKKICSCKEYLHEAIVSLQNKK